jgi:hypothetical protein
MTVSLAVGDLWAPYIPVPGASRLDTTETASSTVRALLAHRAVRQARSVIHAVERGDLNPLPLMLRSLDQETSGFLTRRIANMMAALDRYLTLPAHADVREKLATAFRPMGAWVHGQFAVTSPVLLVVQSILYSHCEWFREHLFEAYSAARAYEDLTVRGFPEAHRRFVAGIIAHQTLLRGAWSTDPEREPREVLAFYRSAEGAASRLVWMDTGGEEGRAGGSLADAAVSRAITRTLYRFISRDRSAGGDGGLEALPALERQLAAALVLHSLCLACRNQRRDTPGLAPLKQRALPFLDYLLDTHTPWRFQPCLAFLQYGTSVHEAERTLLDAALSWIADRNTGPGANEGEEPPGNVSFCFQRASTRRVWAGRAFDPQSVTPVQGFQEAGPGGAESGVWDLITPTVGALSLYRLDDADYIRAALGLPGPRDRPERVSEVGRGGDYPALDAWLASPIDRGRFQAVLRCLFERVEQSHLGYRRILEPGSRYFPAPLVGHVLSQLRDARPGAFSPLHLIGREAGGAGGSPFGTARHTVWLPRYAPSLGVEPGGCGGQPSIGQGEGAEADRIDPWDPCFDGHPDALVARYVAALVLGVAVSFAPRELVLDFVSAQARGGWGPLIDRAVRLNGGPLMRAFVEQVRSRAARVDARGSGSPWIAQASAEDRRRWVKAVGLDGLRVVGIDIGGTSIKWDLFQVGGDPLTGVATFTSRQATTLGWDQGLARCGPEVDPVGAVLAAVRQVCREEVDAVGISLAAPVRDGLPASAVGVVAKLGSVRGIHNANPLEIHRLDLAEAARRAFGAPALPVAVLNDGEADIRDSEEEVVGGGEGVSVLLKEGTGVAFAVHLDGVAVDLLAETSKATLNIRCAVQGKDPESRFPGGTVREYCSKRAYGILLGPMWPEGATPAGEAEDSGDELRDAPTRALGHVLGGTLPGHATFDPDAPPVSAPSAPIIGRLEAIWGQLSAEYGGDLFGLYQDAVAATRERERLEMEEQLRRPTGQGRTGRRDREGRADEWRTELATRVRDLALHRPWQGVAGALRDHERGAVACAWVLGRWLADAIALAWEIYGAREVRLAGGPLSGKTGLYVSKAAEIALGQVYGFDLDVVRVPGTSPCPGVEPVPMAAHRIREAKRLRLVYPPEEGSKGGPRGAAKAAVDAYIVDLRQAQLRFCRDVVADETWRIPERVGEPFLAPEAREEGEGRWSRALGPWLLTDGDVAAMLSAESSALGLTRTQDGRFKKWWGRPGTP